MKAIKAAMWMPVLLAGLLMTSPAFGYSYYAWYAKPRTTWSDADKTPAIDDDDNMCWAAAAANILAWGGWSTPTYRTADDIFSKIVTHWPNDLGLSNEAWGWWLNGLHSQKTDVPGGGNYWPQRKIVDYYTECANRVNAMKSIDWCLHNKYGVVANLENDSSKLVHFMTVWGYDYALTLRGEVIYQDVIVSDSNDNADRLLILPLAWNQVKLQWDVTGGIYRGYRLNGMQGLRESGLQLTGGGPEPTPLPAALPLLASGIAGLGAYGRKRMIKRG
ncbi:MAG: hypothetical protein V2A77_01210 [Pseudomonadota bacterium]